MSTNKRINPPKGRLSAEHYPSKEMKMELEFNNRSESITAKDIADFERRYKFVFPQEIKSFLLVNNGGQPNKTIYTQNSQDYVVDFFLPIKSAEFEDLTYSATMTDLNDIIPNTVIPFAVDPFGNYFVFDKAEGKIYFLEMEEVALSLLASDFESFISSLKRNKTDNKRINLPKGRLSAGHYKLKSNE